METGIMKKVNALFMIMDTFGGDETDYPIVSHSCNCADFPTHGLTLVLRLKGKLN